MYEGTIFISFSLWYWIDSVPSKPGKNFRIGEEGHVNNCVLICFYLHTFIVCIASVT